MYNVPQTAITKHSSCLEDLKLKGMTNTEKRIGTGSQETSQNHLLCITNLRQSHEQITVTVCSLVFNHRNDFFSLYVLKI